MSKSSSSGTSISTPTAIPADGAMLACGSTGFPVWALIGQLRTLDGDLDQLASDYELPYEAVEAALAYYRCNKEYIDARLLLNSA